MNRLIALVTTLLLATGAAFPAQPPSQSWIDSPEAYFATTAERSEWAALEDSAAADRFIAEFWKRRGRDFQREVHTRIAAADKLFSLGNTPGSRTPQGRVWLLLGSPNRQQVIRSETAEVGVSGQFQNNPAERGALRSVRWIYQSDRLPKALGVPELTVRFQTDGARGYQVIENPGLVEPYLKRVAAYVSEQRILAAATDHAQAPPPPARSPIADDPLWNAAELANGAILTGESYVSAKEQTFHAISFYLPRSADAFRNLGTVSFTGLIRSAEGAETSAVREDVAPAPYGSSGDRYVDRSFALAPGKYRAVFALSGADGRPLAVRHVELDVPQATDTRISALLPTGMIETHEQQMPLEPFTFVATKYAVKGDRKFGPADKVGFFTVIENPGGEPEPEIVMTVILSKDGKIIEKSPPAPVGLTQAGPHSWLIGPLFDAGTFPPGAYAIELQLRDMKAPKEPDGKFKTYVVKSDFQVLDQPVEGGPPGPQRP